jgi:pyridoxamine 5'-phosphate oxidase
MSIDARFADHTGHHQGSHDPSLSKAYEVPDQLPEPLPGDPLPLFHEWFAEASDREIAPNPNAMSLATVDADGTPSSRIVLCNRIDLERGYMVFFTNRASRKGRAIEHNRAVAACFHWDVLDRQVRVEGLATLSPESESDRYFAGRGTAKALAAWASEQSKPIESRRALLERVDETVKRFGYDLQTGQPIGQAKPLDRPPHWGGYRVWIRSIELWKGNPSRMHDRAVWTRTLTPAVVDGVDGYEGGPWSATRLQP